MSGLFDDTPEVEVTDQSATEEVVAETEEVSEETAEESSEVEADEPEEVVYEIDGEEVSAEQLKTWKETAAKAKEVESKTAEIESLKEALTAKSTKVDETLAAIEAAEGELEQMILADLADVDLKALRADDYQEYLRTKEAIDERKEAVKALKEKFAGVRRQQLAEQAAALADLRGWSTEAKRTEDLSLLNDYAKSQGFSQDDMKTLTSARVVDALLKAAKLDKEFKEKSKARTKVIKPTTVKAKAKADTAPKAPSSLADRLFSD